MKKIFLLGIIAVILCGCDVFYIGTEHNQSKTYFNSTTTTIHEYNPKSAHADILLRYDAPEGHFVNWQDNRVYVVGIDRIIILDMTNDGTSDNVIFSPNHQVNFNISDLSSDWTKFTGYGIADIGTKILILAKLENEEKSLKTLLSIRHDGSEFMLSDVTTDLVSTTPIYSIYYDSSSNILSTLHSNDNGAMIVKSVYDETNDSFSLMTAVVSHKCYMTKNYYFKMSYNPTVSGYIWNDLSVSSKYYFESFSYHYANLYELCIDNPAVGFFSDGKSFYVYTHEDDYEFVKISFRKR
jgi:hypothetical protein